MSRKHASIAQMLETKNEYDRRYTTTDYMKNWGRPRHRRIIEVIRSIGLPEQGRALDYGCGVGFFSTALQEALPKWEIIGVETSEAALEGARETHPEFTFTTFTEIEGQTFDFVFSHHVLEHVESIEDTAKNIDTLLHKKAWQLHICPCGNEGSLEFLIASKKQNGIDTKQGNRFFYEDPTHLRRLTTMDIEKIFGEYAFHISLESYKNHFWGAISWISNSQPVAILRITKHMPLLCITLLVLHALQRPYRLWWGVWSKKEKTWAHILFLIIACIPAWVLSPVSFALDALVRKEIRKVNTDTTSLRSGSELCIVLARE